MSPELHLGRARIYVSFADEDRTRAMELVRWLNDSGWHVVADDRHAFAAGESWTPSRRLDTCDVILCVITPGWLVSKFCHLEYSYCAKRGKFVLPVICELSDVGLLPQAIRALPRVDLTRNRMIDFLALKEVLTQAGSKIVRAAATSSNAERKGAFAWMLGNRRHAWLLPVALVLAAIVAIWLWA
jgi:TIR domain